MTKTYMLELAESIKRTTPPHVIDNIAQSLGSFYYSKFLGFPITLYTSKLGTPVAIYYKQVMYCLTTVDKVRAAIVRDTYNALKCHTKVFLYDNAHSILYRDEEGVVHYEPKTSPKYGDYAQLIPLPTVPLV